MTPPRLLSRLARLLRRSAPPAGPRSAAPAGRQRAPGGGGTAYPGDFSGTARITYAPYPDDRPDPGEVVWTWVPFEEDHTRGKDRPVLVLGRDDGWLLGLMLTSKDHDKDVETEARHGRRWVDIGTGGWDGQGRPSEVRVDRILRLDPSAVRRQGAALDRPRFEEVARAVRAAGRGG
jgi:hypothetical protein